ncbi:MAG: orotidine-5'-phosphate decarboxylase [Myxococcales bacterium]|nr:orotidine-5'-phosphate decarboxylase [Myxococcales bacterium]
MNFGPAKLCVALDAMPEEDALRLTERLRGTVDVVKIGLGLHSRSGPRIVDSMLEQGHEVFLDLKLHDIPVQVADAVRVACEQGVHYLTLHTGGAGPMMRGASSVRDEFGGNGPRLLGVSILTSMASNDLVDVGMNADLSSVVKKRVALAAECGLDGVVCSPADLSFLREEGQTSSLFFVTPGVRPTGTDAGDQQRITTPAEAVSMGSNMLVVGRPIRNAADPAVAAKAIKAEMEQALG